jgi:TonB family protein
MIQKKFAMHHAGFSLKFTSAFNHLKTSNKKAILILAVSVLSAAFAFAQNPNVDEVKQTTPVFLGEFQTQGNSPADLLKAYLKENVCYPERAMQCKREGTELAQFTITAQGNITDIKIINSVCCEIDNEIITALKNTDGMWKKMDKDMQHEISLAFCCTNESWKPVQVVFKERAIEYFSRASKALFEKHDAEKAMALYSQGIKYLPNDKSLRLMRGLCRYELGDKQGANNDWDRMAMSGFDPIEMNIYMEQMQGLKGYDELMVRLNQ